GGSRVPSGDHSCPQTPREAQEHQRGPRSSSNTSQSQLSKLSLTCRNPEASVTGKTKHRLSSGFWKFLVHDDMKCCCFATSLPVLRSLTKSPPRTTKPLRKEQSSWLHQSQSLCAQESSQ
ncbi:hypothetical protein J0S82_019744, partial [Galemys pyrenaicus]